MCLAYYLQCYCYHIANVIILFEIKLFEIKLFEIILFEIEVFEIFEDLDNFAVDIRWKKCGKQPNIRWKKCSKTSLILNRNFFLEYTREYDNVQRNTHVQNF